MVATDATHAVWSRDVLGDNFFVIDNSDDMNRIAFDPNGTGETTTTIRTNATFDRVITLPNATDTLVGQATSDTLTNKTITDTTNNVAANSLKTTGAVVTVAGAAPPTMGQVLTATSATNAEWQDSTTETVFEDTEFEILDASDATKVLLDLMWAGSQIHNNPTYTK